MFPQVSSWETFRPTVIASLAQHLPLARATDRKPTEQKFAEFALSIKYEALPTDVIAAVKRVVLDTLGCAFGSVGSEPANIAETTCVGGLLTGAC